MKSIITADLHLRPDRPRCRIDDDWLGFQEATIKFIVEEANKRNCLLSIIGDVFGKESPNVPNYITAMFLRYMLQVKKGVRLLAGNHDLPYHSWENVNSSSFGIVNSIIGDKIKYFDDLGSWAHFNEEPESPDQEIQFLHRLVFENLKSLPPNVKACTAQDLLNEFPNAKWIFTGDMHKHFHYEKKGRHVINPGCIIRQASDFINYKPIIYYVDTEKNIVEEIELPDVNIKLVDDSYIKIEEERENRVGAFVEGVKKSGKISLSFIDNINVALEKNNNLSKATIKEIRELMENSNE